MVERSLDDIRYVLDPRFSPAEVARLDTDVSWARALDGSEYMPGLLGLNNMKANDYANVAVQVPVARELKPHREAATGPGTQGRMEAMPSVKLRKGINTRGSIPDTVPNQSFGLGACFIRTIGV